MEERQTWKSLPPREKWQIINATVLVMAAIILYFVAFIVTLTVGMGVVSAGGSMLATALALFGISGFVKNQMLEFETRIDNKMKEYDERERRRNHDNELPRRPNKKDGDISDDI